MSDVKFVQNPVLLESPEVYLALIVAMAVLAALALIALQLASRRRTGRARERPKPGVRVLDSEVRFDQELVLERGSLVYTRILTPYGTTVSHAKWVGTKEVHQTMGVHIKDLCSKPPHVLNVGRGVYVKVPALRVLTENLKNTIIACFDTRGVKARSLVNLVYTGGYARVEVVLGKGTLNASVNWVVLEPAKTRVTREALVVELCSKEFDACAELLRVEKPGSSKVTLNYPEVFRVFVGHGDEKAFDGLYELARNLPSVFGVDGVEVRVGVKSGLKLVAESKATFSQT